MQYGFNYINSTFDLLRILMLDLDMQNELRAKFRNSNILPGMLREI